MIKRAHHMILWVDDDISRLKPFVEELQDEGYQVLQATTPDEMHTALSIEGRGVDLIIMDLILPTGTSMSAEETNFGQSTGKKLIERVKEDSKFRDIPMVLFTIHSDTEIADWCRSKNVKLLRKAQTLPGELLKQVQSILLDARHGKT